MQNEVEGKLQLWVATAYPIWQEVDVKAPDVMEQATARVSACVDVLMERSQAQGFAADLLPSGYFSSFCVKSIHVSWLTPKLESPCPAYRACCSRD